MSLIINTLNKVKKEGEKKYIPPHLVIEKEKNSFKKIRIILLFSFLFVLIGISFYLFFYNSQNLKSHSAQIPEKKSAPEEIYHEPKNLIEYGLVIPEEDEEVKKAVKKKKIISKTEEVKITKKERKKTKNFTETSSTNYISSKTKEKNNFILKKETEKNIPKKAISNFEIITPEKREKIFNKYLLIADKYYLNGNTEKAIEYYEKAVYLKNDISVLNVLLNLYIEEGKINQVVKILTSSEVIYKNEDMISGLIVGMIDKGYVKEADRILSKAVLKDKNGYFLYAKGYLEEKKNNIKDALYFYGKAFEKNKFDPFISYSYGKLEEKNKNYDKAVRIYKTIIEKNPDHRLSKKLEKRLQNLTKN